MNQLFGLAEFLLRLQSFRPNLHLLETLDIGGQPSKAMRCGLVFFNQRVLNPAIRTHHITQAHACSLADCFSRRQSLGGEGEQIWKNYRSCHVHILFLRSRIARYWLRCNLGCLQPQHNFHSKENAILKYYVAVELQCSVRHVPLCCTNDL